MSILKISDSKTPLKEETLKINRTDRRITSKLKFFRFRDKDTRQIVIYIPSLEVSGYGITQEKAVEMLQISLDSCFKHFLDLSIEKMDAELRRLGWVHSRFKKKDYSKCFVDNEGNLKNFNAVGDEVEEGVLTL